MAKAIVIAAPSSGSGKTVVTLGILRALRNRGLKVASAKVGPDYIDPRFHEAATGRPCFNLDPWAMSTARMSTYLHALAADADILVIEGVMGLFDGPLEQPGSTADVAREFGACPVLVVDCSHMGQSIRPLMRGYLEEIFMGLPFIFNRVASDRHEAILKSAIPDYREFLIGCIRRDGELNLPSRHLGLVQASEHPEIETFLERAAEAIEQGLDISQLLKLCYPLKTSAIGPKPFPKLAQTVAVASDEAFAFAYPHMLHDWRAQGVEILPFSPLADEAPHGAAEAIFLPGGYPELHAGRLSANANFMQGLRQASAAGKLIYGECGGFMVLGDYIIDKEGQKHAMAGLLPLGTSFADRKLHLGYRILEPLNGAPFTVAMRGHEFHYSTIDWQGEADPLYEASDASELVLDKIGLRRANVMGSYAHVIAPEAE